ncbi:MAG: hypothetical protein GY715_19555 [Planctomycetes bacterium]|nr:hypothetical protein [Planctomycetota bacterium]
MRSLLPTLLALALAIGSATEPALASTADATTQHRHDIVNASLGLARSDLVSLEYDPAVGVPLTITVPVAGAERTLDLRPYSVRSAGHYKVYRSDGPDHLAEVAPGPVNTLRGFVVGTASTAVAASLRDDGFRAMIQLADGERYWVEPAGHLVDGLAPGTHVVYHESDTMPHEGSCGVNDAQLARERADHGPQAVDGAGPADGVGLANTELAFDADLPYFDAYGQSVANVEARINEITNVMNVQYESEVDITHVITTIIVRTSPTYASTDPDVLLDELRDQWEQHHTGVVRDVVQLFTGRELDGPIIGIAAAIGGICGPSAYCLSQSDYNGNFNCATDLSAHELGHLWGGFHCGCPNGTMNPLVVCANTFIEETRIAITSYRTGQDCLNPVGAYCTGVSLATGAQAVSNVTFGAIDHDSGGGTYSDFTSITTDLTEGTTVPFSMTVANAAGSELAGLWIDWNGDADFQDLHEHVASFSGTGPHAIDVLVPGQMVPGATRMRVRVQDGTTDPDLAPCGLTDAGEVEDYGLTLFATVPPPNDDCQNATPIGEETVAFTTFGASTDGPIEPQLCNSDGDDDIGGDIWFSFTAPCGGQFTASLCGSDYDTRLGVYNSCPTGSLQIIACSDDFCGEQSQVNFVGFGGEFLIRVGGYLGEKGTGTLSLSAQCLDAGACCLADGGCALLSATACDTAGGTFNGIGVSCNPNPCPQPCPEDLNGNDSVDFADILEIIAAWGPCPPQCPEDLDGSGDVGFGDILTVIGAWGPC